MEYKEFRQKIYELQQILFPTISGKYDGDRDGKYLHNQKNTLENSNEQYITTLYSKNIKECINTLIDSFPAHSPYQPFFPKDYDFINSESENVKNAVINAINESNRHTYSSKHTYLKSLDITLDELVEIAKFYVFPPFPLINSNYDNVVDEQKIQRICHIENCNIYKVLNGNEKLCEYVISGKRKGNIEIKFINGDEEVIYFLHDHILEQYNYFEKLFKYDENKCYTLYVDELKIVIPFIKSLYTGKFNHIDMNNDEIKCLSNLFDFCDILNQKQICDVILNDLEEAIYYEDGKY